VQFRGRGFGRAALTPLLLYRSLDFTEPKAAALSLRL
jgi:hypothetical protein